MAETSLNPREQLLAAANWLGMQHEDLSYGLKKPEDGLKLWRYAQNHPADLAEFCDEVTGELGDWTDAHFKAAIGYNPFTRCQTASRGKPCTAVETAVLLRSYRARTSAVGA